MGRRFVVTGGCAIAFLSGCGGLLGIDFGPSSDDGTNAESADSSADGVVNASGGGEGADAANLADGASDADAAISVGAADAGADGGGSVYPRIARFEMNVAVGADGADDGSGMVLEKTKPISGAASVTSSGSGFLRWTLSPSPAELFLAFALRLDKSITAFGSVAFLYVTFDGTGFPIQAYIDGGGTVTISAVGGSTATLGAMTVGASYRLGLHVNPVNANVQATLIDANTEFADGTYHSVTWGAPGAPQHVQLIDPGGAMTFDDVVISDVLLTK